MSLYFFSFLKKTISLSLLTGLGFSSLCQAVTLEEALQSALQKNESVGVDHESTVQVEEQVKQAKGSILPNIALNATHLTQPKPRDPAAAQFFPAEQTTVNFTLKQPLFRGFREFAAVRQRNNMLNARKQNEFLTKIQLYESVATSYLQVLALEQDLKNLKDQVDLNTERVKELQGRTRRGESRVSEGLTAQSAAAVLESDVQLVQSQLRSARENFAFITGLPADSTLVDTSQEPTIIVKPVEEYLNRIEERPDIKVAKENFEAADEEVSIAKGGHWPTLDFLGNYYVKRPEGYLADMRWDAQFMFSLPLFEGGVSQSLVREAASKRGQSELLLQKLRRQMISEIRSLHENLRMRADQLKALKNASEISQRNYQVLQRDFRRGLSPNTDVQLALTDYRISRRSYDQARYAAQLDKIRLETAAAYVPQILEKEM